MSSAVAFVDLLDGAHISKLQPLLERPDIDMDRFVSAYLRTAFNGAATLMDVNRHDSNVQFIRRLIELFNRVDSTGRGMISWEQFSTFAAEVSLVSTNIGGGSETVGKIMPIVYRESPKFRAPYVDELPSTNATCVKWIPELQELFVTYEESSTCYVFNHLCRLIARIHANVPPDGVSVSSSSNGSSTSKGNQEKMEALRAKFSLREAISVQGIKAEMFNASDAPRSHTQLEDQLQDGASSVDSDWDMPLDGVDGEDGGLATKKEGEEDLTQHGEDENPEVKWAKRILRQKVSMNMGDRMKAAQILANVRCIAEARKTALLKELGTGMGKHNATLSIKEQLNLEKNKKQATFEARLLSNRRGKGSPSPTRPSTVLGNETGAELEAMHDRQKKLSDAVTKAVETRSHLLAAKKGYAIEHATTKQVLLSHPAGFSLFQAERLRKAKMADVSKESLTVMGTKSSGSVRWGKLGSILSRDSGADQKGAAEMSKKMEEQAKHGGMKTIASGTNEETVASATGGKPQVSSSAAMIAYDPGPQGKPRDFGYLVEPIPRFSKDKDDSKAKPGKVAASVGDATASAAMSKITSAAEMGNEGAAVASHNRIESLAMPRGTRALISLLSVEYCMPVSRNFSSDLKKWRSIMTIDVRHIVAISSSELVITLWSTKTFEFAGVIHTLLPQNVLTWSTGANALITSNSFVGPISCWDLLTGSKITQLNEHDQPVQCLADVATLGCFVSGSLDTTIKIWGYRPEGDSANNDVGGVRGKSPPIKPHINNELVGHANGVTNLKVIEDTSPGSTTRLISVALGAEICIWDLLQCTILVKVAGGSGGSGKTFAGISALTITNSQPPYALTVDEENVLRVWTLETLEGSGTGMGECVDTYHIEDVPFGGVSSIVTTTPHSHVIVGGRKLAILAPEAPIAEGSGSSNAGYLMPVSAKYSDELTFVVIAEGNGVTVFDARTGDRYKRIEGLMPQVIVSLEIDGTGRKALVGDAGGDVFVFNIIEGLVTSKFSPSHEDDVTGLVNVAEDGLFFTASWDRSIRCYDALHRANEKIVPMIRLIQNAHSADITCLAVSRKLALIATGSADGVIRVWDLCSFDFIAELRGHVHGITRIAFPSPATMPLLVSVDDGGYLYIFAVRGSLYSDRLLLGLVNVGHASGPPPPSLKVLDLSMMKSQEERNKVGYNVGGTVQIGKFQDSTGGLEALELNDTLKKRAKEKKVSNLSSLLKSEMKLARDVESISMTSPKSSKSDPFSSLGSSDGNVSGLSLSSSIVSPLQSPRLVQVAPNMDNFQPSPVRNANLAQNAKDKVNVPISSLAVFATDTGNDDDIDTETQKATDHNKNLVFKVFTGDGQGVIKQWDLSSIITKIAHGGVTGIGIIPSKSWLCNAMAYNPRQVRQKLYPDTEPAAFDPEVEAAKAANEAMAKRISSLRKKTQNIGESYADQSKAMLLRLRMLRDLYHTARLPVKKRQPKTNEDDIRGLSMYQMDQKAEMEAKERGELESKDAGDDTDDVDSPLAVFASPGKKARPASAASTAHGKSEQSSDENSAGLSYPKVEAFFGGIVLSKFPDEPKPLPLLPTLMQPKPYEKHHMRSFGESPHPLSSIDSVKAALFESSKIDSLHELSAEIQDEIWHTFDSKSASYIRMKATAVALAEAEARKRGWEVETNPLLINGGGKGGRASSAGPKRTTVSEMSIMVPLEAWVASRIRRDIQPVAVWTGHIDALTSISVITSPYTLLTTSLDGSTRMWTFNGLPVGVVNAPPRNIALERALSAAAAVGGDPDGAPKVVKNLNKEDTLWQFIPDDVQKIQRSTAQANLIWKRLTHIKHHQKPNDIHLHTATEVHRNLTITDFEKDVSNTKKTRTAIDTARDTSGKLHGKLFALAAEATTLTISKNLEIAHAHAHAHEEVKVPVAPAPASFEGKQRSIDMDLVYSIENFDKISDINDESNKHLFGNTQKKIISVIPGRDSVLNQSEKGISQNSGGVDSNGRRLSLVQTMRMYPNLSNETSVQMMKRKAMEADFLATIDAEYAANINSSNAPVLSSTSGATRPTSAASVLRKIRPQSATSTVIGRTEKNDQEAHVQLLSALNFIGKAANTAPELNNGVNSKLSSIHPILHSSLPPSNVSSERPSSAASSLVRNLRVSAAAARAAGSLDSVLEPLTSLVKPFTKPNSSPEPSSKVEEEFPFDGKQRVLSTLDRANILMQLTERRGFASAPRRRAEDVLDAAKESQAAAKARADHGLDPIVESSNSNSSGNSSESASRPLTKRPDSAHTAKGSISTRPRSAATMSVSPAALLNQKSFGMYPMSQIEKFRETWMQLDDDGSGAVDVEELLNANIFAASQMKVTKAIFGSIDADKSGDVSLGELVKVVFPMGGPEVRSQIISYVKYVIAMKREEKERLKEGGLPSKKKQIEAAPVREQPTSSSPSSSKHVKIDTKTAEDLLTLEEAHDERLKRKSR